MAQINKIQSFKSFSEIIAQEKAIKETQANATKRGQLSSKISAILDEMNITSFEGLDQKVKEEFIKKVFGEVAEEQSEEIMEGTRSQFGKIDKAGNITSVYIHYDGYPENMLPIIKKGYKSGSGVDTVIAGGSAASLEKDPKSMDYYGDNRLLKGSIKRIDKYFKDANDNSSAEYVYLWDESTKQWMMADLYSDPKLMPITESMLNEKLSTEQKMVETFLKKIAKEFDYSIEDAARFVKDTISKMGLNESMNEEIDIYDRLGDLMNNLNTEIGNLKGSTKDTQWLKQLDLIQSALEKLEDRVSIATKKLGVIPESMNKEGDAAEVNEGKMADKILAKVIAVVEDEYTKGNENDVASLMNAVSKKTGYGVDSSNANYGPASGMQAFRVAGFNVLVSLVNTSKYKSVISKEKSKYTKIGDWWIRLWDYVNEAEKIEVGSFVRYKKDKDFTGGKIISIKGSDAEIHNWDGSTIKLPFKDLEYVKSWNESAMNESFEVHYSDGIRSMKKFGNEKQAITFAKDLIKNKSGLQFVDVFKAGSGFHSTADTSAIVAFWGDGSYTDNVAKKDDKLASKKINEAEVKSDEEFKEYAFTVLKKAFGEEFDEAKAQEVVDGILGKVDGDYGAAVGMLTSSLG